MAKKTTKHHSDTTLGKKIVNETRAGGEPPVGKERK